MEKIREMDFLAIIQARFGSTRLSNKVLLEFSGKTILEHVISRVSQSKFIDEVGVATTIDKNNFPIIKLCLQLGVRIFVGSEDDVLDRYYQFAKLLKPKNIVRITSDCPVIDPDIIDKTIETFRRSKADYSNNRNTPDGLASEVFSFNTLEEAWGKAILTSEREHVTPYIKKHFKVEYYTYPTDLSNKRWTIDEPEDYEFLKILYDNLYSENKIFLTQDILDFLEKNPDIEKINHHIKRDEGYAKSLKEDKIINKE